MLGCVFPLMQLVLRAARATARRLSASPPRRTRVGPHTTVRRSHKVGPPDRVLKCFVSGPEGAQRVSGR